MNEYSSLFEMTHTRDNALHKTWQVTKPLSPSAQGLHFAFQHKQKLLLKGLANKILS